jgi:hypothetical protein
MRWCCRRIRNRRCDVRNYRHAWGAAAAAAQGTARPTTIASAFANSPRFAVRCQRASVNSRTRHTLAETKHARSVDRNATPARCNRRSPDRRWRRPKLSPGGLGGPARLPQPFLLFDSRSLYGRDRNLGRSGIVALAHRHRPDHAAQQAVEKNRYSQRHKQRLHQKYLDRFHDMIR